MGQDVHKSAAAGNEVFRAYSNRTMAITKPSRPACRSCNGWTSKTGVHRCTRRGKSFTCPRTQYRKLIEFKQNSEEDGALNLRNESKWNDLITQYSPEAAPLNGSQYLFIYNGELLSVEDLGNAIFGYYGSAMGFSADLLYLGAEYAAVAKAIKSNQGSSNGYMGDSPDDRAMIDLGISWYLEGK